MYTRTTFAHIEVVGPCVPWHAMRSVQPGHPDYNRLANLVEKASTDKFISRRGHWKPASIKALAQRGGVVLLGAYSEDRDSKGFLPSTKSQIV